MFTQLSLIFLNSRLCVKKISHLLGKTNKNETNDNHLDEELATKQSYIDQDILESSKKECLSNEDVPAIINPLLLESINQEERNESY